MTLLGVFFLTLRQYERSNHLVFLLSHDLKSPLAIIKMYAENLGAKLEADPQALQPITRSADRMLRLVENFLDASRAGGREPGRGGQHVQLRATVRAVAGCYDDCSPGLTASGQPRSLPRCVSSMARAMSGPAHASAEGHQARHPISMRSLKTVPPQFLQRRLSSSLKNSSWFPHFLHATS